MLIQNIPESYSPIKGQHDKLFVYDFKMTEDVVNNKVNLTHHMFSFLQKGEKRVQFAEHIVEVNNKQSVLIKSGNCLMTECLSTDEVYYCKLFFFSNHNIQQFLKKYNHPPEKPKNRISTENPFFLIDNDNFIDTFVTSISWMINSNGASIDLLTVKFDEIMLYLSHKYGDSFVDFIRSLVSTNRSTAFQQIIEANIYANLSLNDLAFLSNMSLSTFKRQFEKEYNMKPGKWFQKKRLQQARRILQNGEKCASQIYSDFGYKNISNFSIAFKNEFGFSPKEAIGQKNNKFDLFS
jgi:AraC family transcriptional regulator, exoenzyme S synthesis regulatory protein ExsA